MLCMLQRYPPEALDHGAGDESCLDVIAVDRSRVALEEFLEAYEPRYRAACDAFQSWDRDKRTEWTSAHDDMLDELARKYCVHGSLIPDTESRIVEALEGPRIDAADEDTQVPRRDLMNEWPAGEPGRADWARSQEEGRIGMPKQRDPETLDIMIKARVARLYADALTAAYDDWRRTHPERPAAEIFDEAFERALRRRRGEAA